MRLLLCLLLLTGCKAHHLFGPTKPPSYVTPRDYVPERCYLTITINGVTQYVEIPCD